MNDYSLMCMGSPIQKEYKPKFGSKYRIFLDDKFLREEIVTSNWQKEIGNAIWHLTQEEWQDIYNSMHLTLYKLCTSIPFIIHAEIIKNVGLNLSEYMTMLWCLFYHQEVHDLKWSWTEKKWVK